MFGHGPLGMRRIKRGRPGLAELAVAADDEAVDDGRGRLGTVSLIFNGCVRTGLVAGLEARALGLGSLSMILGRAATAAKRRLGREWIRRPGVEVHVEFVSPALRVRSPLSLRLFGDLSTSISLIVSRFLLGDPGCQPGTVGRRGLVGVDGAHEGDLGRSEKVLPAGWTCSWGVTTAVGPVRSSHNRSKKGSSWACG
jgi:hypothetical protein